MYRMFSRDVTAAMVSLKGMAGTLVSPTGPSGIFSFALVGKHAR